MKKLFVAIFVSILVCACSDPMEKLASQDQIEKVQAALADYPELSEEFTKLRENGVVTKGDIMEIIQKATAIKEAREKK